MTEQGFKDFMKQAHYQPTAYWFGVLWLKQPMLDIQAQTQGEGSSVSNDRRGSDSGHSLP